MAVPSCWALRFVILEAMQNFRGYVIHLNSLDRFPATLLHELHMLHAQHIHLGADIVGRCAAHQRYSRHDRLTF